MQKANDTFYFLKVELGIDTCEEVAAVERMKHGPEYLWLWIRLALKYTNYNGVLCRRIGNEVLPVTADEIEAEMKGGFSDVSIKDGVATLIRANLIFINSDGFMQITGLVLTGDPLEPTLHKQNSNRTDIRPLSVGKDTKTAAYFRNYRKLKKDEETKLLEFTSPKTMTYLEIAKKAKCSKQNVINHTKRLCLESYIISQGQKKFIPYNLAQYIICEITGKKVPQDVLDSLRFDGFDGLLQEKELSNNCQVFDSEPSNNNNGPSKTYKESVDKQMGFDGFANANFDASSGATIPLFENKRNTDIEDDYIYPKTVKTRVDLYELFRVGFEKEPTRNDITRLSQLIERVDYDLLLSQLKIARKHNAKSIDYVTKCITNLNLQSDSDESLLHDAVKIDCKRDIAPVLEKLEDDFRLMKEEQIEDLTKSIKALMPFYTDSELLNALRTVCAYRAYSGEALRFIIYRLNAESAELDRIDEAQLQMKLNSFSGVTKRS